MDLIVIILALEFCFLMLLRTLLKTTHSDGDLLLKYVCIIIIIIII